MVRRPARIPPVASSSGHCLCFVCKKVENSFSLLFVLRRLSSLSREQTLYSLVSSMDVRRQRWHYLPTYCPIIWHHITHCGSYNRRLYFGRTKIDQHLYSKGQPNDTVWPTCVYLSFGTPLLPLPSSSSPVLNWRDGRKSVWEFTAFCPSPLTNERATFQREGKNTRA